MRLTVADHQHAVVQSSAAGRIKDAASIQLELALVSLNGHADGLVGRRLYGHRQHQTMHDWASGPWHPTAVSHTSRSRTHAIAMLGALWVCGGSKGYAINERL